MTRSLEMRRRLFDGTPTKEVFARWHQRALTDVASLPADALLTASLDGLVDGIVAAYRIEPLVLHRDLKTADFSESETVREDAPPGDASVDAAVSAPSATVIIESIPFSGAEGLFDMRPSNAPPEPVYGSVRRAGLTLSWVGVHPDAPTIKADFDGQEAILEAWVSAVDDDVDRYDTELRNVVRAAVKGRLATLRAGAQTVTQLGVRLRHPDVGDGPVSRDRRRQQVTRAPDASGSTPRRGPGRPGWTPDLFEERWSDASRLTPPPRTLKALAKHFRGLDGSMGQLTGDHLGRLRRRFPGPAR